MPRPASSDTRFLEQMRGKWRVTIAVPRALHATLGTRLKRPLDTDSLAVANRLKWPVISEMRAEIERAQHSGDQPDVITREAVEMAARRTRAVTDKEVRELEDEVAERSQAILGEPIGIEDGAFGTQPEPVYDPKREARADAYFALASGNATPIDLYHTQFVGQSQTKARTKADDKRALRFLLAWCAEKGMAPTLQAITRKAAGRFMDDLGSIAGGQGPVTLNKYLNRLSRYWQWLQTRDLVELDVWAKLKLAQPRPVHGEEERAFTDDEVARLIGGPATPHMGDLMCIAALNRPGFAGGYLL